MLHTRCLWSVLCLAIMLMACASCPAAQTGDPVARFAGTTALLIQPENSYYGYDFTIQAALMRRGFSVTPGPPEALADAAGLQAYDLVVTNLKRSFTPAQVAGLKAYVAAGGALYANWGGPMGCPELLSVCGVKNARSVYLRELTLTDSPLTGGKGELRWAFPAYSGHAKLGEKGHEMVAFERTDGLEVARDSEGHCLGTLREEGSGRCALLGFCPSNYRFVTDDSAQADGVLDNLLAWLLPGGPRPQPVPQTLQVSLPRGASISAVSLNGRPVPQPQVQTLGSLTAVTVPVGALAEGKTATVHVACKLPPVSRHIQTWIHDPVASSFLSFEPAAAADFFASLQATVVQPLLRYEGGSACYLRGIPGDQPRERFRSYSGDLLADYLKACHARGIKVIGGLYLDWKRFAVHLAEAPPQVAKGQAPPERKIGQAVCPLDSGVWEHNVAIVQNLLDNYPDLDGLILDDNFEFDGKPCYCQTCLGKFAAYCGQQPRAVDPQAEAEAGGEVWKAFWKGEKLAFCKRIHDVCAARSKPVGGWTGQRGPVAFRGVFDFAGNMVYVEPSGSVAPLWPLVDDFPVVTLLWGMDRKPVEIGRDLVEAIRAGSDTVGFWIAYARVEGATDNPWSLGSRPRPDFSLTPGTLTAIQRAFGQAEQTWQDYYRDNLILGDPRFVVSNAKFDTQGLTVTIKRLGQPSGKRLVGPADLSALLKKRP